MIVNVTGSNKEKRAFVKHISEYCGFKLIDLRLLEDITINIKLVKSLIEKQGVHGEIDIEEYDQLPYEFTIRLHDDNSLKTLLTTCCHEMVHVSQYATGKLVHANVTLWRGDVFDADDENYYDHPWEIEAFGRENALLDSWLMATSNKILE